MNFNKVPKPTVTISNDWNDFYECDAPYYSMPPRMKVDLSEVDKMIDERLSILTVFDTLKNDTAAGSSEFHKLQQSALIDAAKGLYDPSIIDLVINGRSKSRAAAVKKPTRLRDYLSHFLLRIYFCRSSELRDWFVARESDLLSFRLRECISETENLLKMNNINFELIHKAPSQNTELFMRANIVETPRGSTLFRLPFEKAMELVKKRRVFVKDGYAYIYPEEMVSVITRQFRAELKRCLVRLHNQLPRLNEDNRLIPLVHSIHEMKVVNKKKATQERSADRISPAEIDDLSKESFPPCMENIYFNLKKTHHIKHYARIHYGLFLKTIGLSVEDAIEYFRNEFTKDPAMTQEKFDRDYKYGIRYNYGLEGKKVNLSAYSCNKIINNNPPGPGDFHGCPFKHFDENNLRNLLSRRSLESETIDNVIEFTKNKACTQACGAYFTACHPNYSLPEEGVYHPNQYYKESRRYLKGAIYFQSTQEEPMESEPTPSQNDSVVYERLALAQFVEPESVL